MTLHHPSCFLWKLASRDFLRDCYCALLMMNTKTNLIQATRKMWEMVCFCACVCVTWIWSFVNIEQHIFQTSILKILSCIHSVSRISLSVWWHSCLPHGTACRFDSLEASGWNKSSSICMRNSHPSPGTAQEWPRGAQIHHIDLRQESIRRAPWQYGAGIWKILRRERHDHPEGMIDLGPGDFRGTGVTVLGVCNRR